MRQIFIEGYAAVFGACENGTRISPRCSFVAVGHDLPLTINHANRFVQLATLRAGTLEVFTDRTGLGFSMQVEDTDQDAGGVLQALATMPYCSFLGDEETHDTADGVKEITGVSLRDICLTSSPWFSATGAWRSDMRYPDLRGQHLRLQGEFERGIKNPHERTPLATAWGYRRDRIASAAVSPGGQRARRPATVMTPPAAAATHRPRAAYEAVDVIAVCNEITARNRAHG